MVTTTCEEVSACGETQIQANGITEEANVVVTEDDFLKAQKLFQQGKKNLILNKYDEATNNIADVCKTYSMKYGELNSNCAEVYFYYGKALLELSRVENTVLGNALTGVSEVVGEDDNNEEAINDSRYGNPDTVPEEEREEIFDKVIDAMCPTEENNKEAVAAIDGVKPSTDEPKIEEKKVEGEVEVEKKVEEKMETAESKVSTTTEEVVTPKEGEEVKAVVNGECGGVEKKEEKMEEVDGEEEEEEEVDGEEGEEDVDECDKKEEDDEDVTNLQQSWEMFELAKVIYTKKIDAIEDNDEKLKIKIRIAECLLKLGEISIEQELFDQAITDLKESIKIQEEISANERDERLLAETYYQLTLAHQFNNEFDLAKESQKKSTNILDIRIEKLKSKLSDAALAESEKTEINDEIGELEKLLPEMILKMEEINEQNEKQLSIIKEAKECLLSEKPQAAVAAVATTVTPSVEATTTENGTSTNGEVKDITEMIKSKRKLSTDKLDVNAKKTKVDNEDDIAPIPAEVAAAAAVVTEDNTSEKPMEESTTATPATVAATSEVVEAAAQ